MGIDILIIICRPSFPLSEQFFFLIQSLRGHKRWGKIGGGGGGG